MSRFTTNYTRSSNAAVRACVAVACGIVMLCPSSAKAGVITTSLLDGDETDIVNTGFITIDAKNFGGTGTRTVNGIVHADSNGDLGPVDFSGPFGNPDSIVFTGDLFELLDGLAGTFDANEPGTFSVGGLTVGTSYLLQVYWLTKDAGRTLDFTAEGDSLIGIVGTPISASGTLISYAYTALDDTLNVSITGDGVDSNVFISGYSLQTVPEPSSFLMLGIGAIGLGLVRRRRKL